MAGGGVAMHLSVGESGLEVVQVDVGEHPVARPPDEQRRNAMQVGEPGGHIVEAACGRVVGLERNVFHELGDRPATVGGAIGGEVAAADRRWRSRVRQLEHAAKEGGGVDGRTRQQPGAASVADKRRC